jgi:hypothetical protein
MLKARYKNKEGKVLDIPLIEDPLSKQFLLETERGQLAKFEDLIHDATFGDMVFVELIEEKPPLPQPGSPDRSLALADLSQVIDCFPAADLEAFVAQPGQRELGQAIHARNGFASATLDKIIRWKESLDAEIQRRQEERKREEPPLQLGRYELTTDFYHSRTDFGDLKIDGPEPRQHGTAASGFEDSEWWVYCGKCEKPGLEARYTTARVLLEIEAGRREKFICQGPCRG